MKTDFKNDIGYSEVTPKSVWLNRRQLFKRAGSATIAASLAGAASGREFEGVFSPLSTDEELNDFDDITGYNNFYEFGTGKSDPSRYASNLTVDPWDVEIGGLVGNPGTYSFDDIIAGVEMEERIYRLRCVEAWSMVIPWIGFPLSALLDKIEPDPSAKYVAFETLVRPDEMRGQRSRLLEWPYREGLRLDEAMNPLTILAVGLYGEELPNQNGAPLRLVVPWKYGYKSIKSIVRITLTDFEPPTTWNMQAPGEYGFYSNVNPLVDHPRWSQASERRVGGGLFAKRIKTKMFNGYEEHVASLYDGMDLRENY